MSIAAIVRSIALPSAILFLSACGGADKAASSVENASSSSKPSSPAKAQPASRILPVTEFRSRIVRPEGVRIKPTPQQLEVQAGIEAAYARVPSKDLREVNMLMTCESRKRGSMVPFDQKATAISVARDAVASTPKAGSECLTSLPR